MKNQLVAATLTRVADLMEIDAVDYRTKAYRRAAHTVENLSEDIEVLKNEEKLQELPGVGEKIAKKIDEIIETGSLGYLENLKKKFPVDYDALMGVEGLGPGTIRQLYRELGIKNLEDLEKNAKRHRIRRLKGMGDKTEKKILTNLEYAKKGTGRNLLGEILPVAEDIKRELKGLEFVDKVEIAGSIRRMKETVGDVDILVVTEKPLEVMDYFINMNIVDDVVVSGPLKSTVRFQNGIEVDIRVFKEESFGSAMLYFTGSKENNVELRKIAIKNLLKLSEYGVFSDDERVAGLTESEVFEVLGMGYIEPELRENTGEIEAATSRTLPELLKYDEIIGDLQMHTSWSDGKGSIMDMVLECQKMGYKYMSVTDHSGSLKIAKGMNEKTIKEQMDYIDSLNHEIKDFRILKGVETNIDSYGFLDVPDRLLEEIDIVVAGIHSGFKQDTHEITRRILSAMENENVNIIAHPTGRKILGRKGYELDLERIFEASLDTGTYLEVNSRPNRLDLNDINIKMAVEHGVKLVVNSDAHSPGELHNMMLGIGTLRRGWAKKVDVINTLPLEDLLKLLN